MAAIRYYIQRSAINRENPVTLTVDGRPFSLSRDDSVARYYIQVDGFQEVGRVVMWPGMEQVVEYITAHLHLPVECWQNRETGHYAYAGSVAMVRGESNLAYFEGSRLEDIRDLWQALLDGTIRPERPLFNKVQDGLSYSELTTAVAELTPQLKQAMLQLGEAESTLIHLRAVVRSCSDALAQQRSEIDRAIAERDDAMRQLAALQG